MVISRSIRSLRNSTSLTRERCLSPRFSIALPQAVLQLLSLMKECRCVSGCNSNNQFPLLCVSKQRPEDAPARQLTHPRDRAAPLHRISGGSATILETALSSPTYHFSCRYAG